MKALLGPLMGVLLAGCGSMALTPDETDLIVEQTVLRIVENASEPAERAREIERWAETARSLIGPGAGLVLWSDIETTVTELLVKNDWRQSDIRLLLQLLERRVPGALDAVAGLLPLAPEQRAAILIDIERVKAAVQTARLLYQLEG